MLQAEIIGDLIVNVDRLVLNDEYNMTMNGVDRVDQLTLTELWAEGQIIQGDEVVVRDLALAA